MFSPKLRMLSSSSIMLVFFSTITTCLDCSCMIIPYNYCFLSFAMSRWHFLTQQTPRITGIIIPLHLLNPFLKKSHFHYQYSHFSSYHQIAYKMPQTTQNNKRTQKLKSLTFEGTPEKSDRNKRKTLINITGIFITG